MPKRGGLGRGLDALIPPERKKQKASKTDENEVTIEKGVKSTKKEKARAKQQKNLQIRKETSSESKNEGLNGEEKDESIIFDFEAPIVFGNGKKENASLIESQNIPAENEDSDFADEAIDPAERSTDDAISQDEIDSAAEEEDQPLPTPNSAERDSELELKTTELTTADESVLNKNDAQASVAKNGEEKQELPESDQDTSSEDTVHSDDIEAVKNLNEADDRNNTEKSDIPASDIPASPSNIEKTGDEENGDHHRLSMSFDSDSFRGTEEDDMNETEFDREGPHTNAFETSEEEVKKESDRNTERGEVIMMRISLVEPNRDQPRKYFDDDAIDELADSIRQFGIIQPLLVQKKDDYYQIIAGERRWRAAKKCGLKEVPVIIRRFSNQEAVEVALIENIQREDLNPIEEARAYQRLVNEYALSQEEVAGRVSKSRSAVTNSMRLLRLDESIQAMVETGAISEGHARTLIPLPTAKEQLELAERIIKEKLSVRQTEKLVKELLKPSEKKRRQTDEKRDVLLQELSEQLKHSLGTKVSIRQSGKNKGKIEIEYYSDEELDRLYELLRSLNS